jgi:hypothetical protein
MSIVAIFDVPDMNQEKYDNVIKELESVGLGKFDARPYHVASVKEGGGMVVVDVYTSVEEFAKFGESLMPILIKNGINPPQPQVHQVHNIVN